jgi:hypothetical protein
VPEPAPACAAWQERLAGWLLAQVGPEDEAALVDHLAACPTCGAEAESLLGIAAVTLGADPGVEPASSVGEDEPPADLADRIVARVATERRAAGRRRVAIVLVGIAAAAVLAVVLTRDPDAPLDGEPVTFARLAPGVEADATVAPDGGGSLVELTASGLDPGTTYALWLTPPGGSYRERVPAGTFRADAEGQVEVRLHSALPAAEAGRVWATTPAGQIAMDTEEA